MKTRSMLCSLLLLALLFSQATASEKPVRKRHLFLDPAFAVERENVEIRVNPPKSKEIVIRRDTPAEAHMIGLYLTVMEEDGKIKMWYTGRPKPKSSRCTYAESTDGVHWTKPSLNLFKLDDNTDNHVYATISSEGTIFRDPNARSESERYVTITSIHKQGGVFRFTSPDGLRNWKKDKHAILPFECDSQNVCFWDPNIQKYVLYLRAWTPFSEKFAPGRKVARYETDDLTRPSGIVPVKREKKFPSDPERDPFIVDEIPTVLRCDENDPPDTDIYTNAMQTYPVDPTWYLGFPAFFRHDKESPLRKHATDGRLEIQFVASQDGVHWERFDRSTYVGLGLRNDENANMNFMGVGMIVRGDEIWQYGTAYKTTHGNIPGRIEMCDGVVYRYVQRIDGFVSLDFPTTGTGRCVTRPVTVTNSKMLLNLDAGALGELKVGILNENGDAISGYAPEDANPVMANDTGAVVSWKEKSDLAALVGQTVRIELSGSRTKLYSIRFE